MTDTETAGLEALRAEVAALRAEVAALRGHVCPGPTCTCMGTATAGLTGCPVHTRAWLQVRGSGVAPGAAGAGQTYIVNTTACADRPLTVANPVASACAGGHAGHVYTVLP